MSRIAFSGLRHLLRRLDFVYKKPKAIPGKADKVAGGGVALRLIEAKLAEIFSCGAERNGRLLRFMVLIRNIIPIAHTVGSRGARTKRSRPTVLYS